LCRPQKRRGGGNREAFSNLFDGGRVEAMYQRRRIRLSLHSSTKRERERGSPRKPKKKRSLRQRGGRKINPHASSSHEEGRRRLVNQRPAEEDRYIASKGRKSRANSAAASPLQGRSLCPGPSRRLGLIDLFGTTLRGGREEILHCADFPHKKRESIFLASKEREG